MSSSAPDPSYTVFIRLPFPREDFIDPPAVEWDAAKDKALWKVLSKASKNSDVDWAELANKFDVTLAFLLQQAAWLYERQLQQVRAQMRKVGVSKGSLTPSPVPGGTSEISGGEHMRRTGSGGGGPRVQSSLSQRKDSPIPKNDSNTSHAPGRSAAPPFSRTTSANTTVQNRNKALNTSPRPVSAALDRRSHSPKVKSRPPSIAVPPSQESQSSSGLSSSPQSSSSSAPAQSRIFRRPPRFPSTKKVDQSADADADDDDEEEDDDPAFMPFIAKTNINESNDPSATLRGDPRNAIRRLPSHSQKSKSDNHIPSEQKSQTSDSSASSAPQTVQKPVRHNDWLTGPLSPRRTLELAAGAGAGKSPGPKGKSMGLGRDGSEGSPSMGSSFSDLDDASVTQSALEEALASNMQSGGGMASRMSSISQALRSRYI